MACIVKTDLASIPVGDEMIVFHTPLEAAIETEYMNLSDIHAWADKAVDKFLRPKAWTIELVCCDSNDKAFRIVCATESHDVRGVNFDRGRLSLGFHLLKFRENRISVTDLEGCILDEVDPYSVDGWDPESVGELFRRIDPAHAEFLREIECKFGVYGDEAARCYNYLQSDKCLADHENLFSHATEL